MQNVLYKKHLKLYQGASHSESRTAGLFINRPFIGAKFSYQKIMTWPNQDDGSNSKTYDLNNAFILPVFCMFLGGVIVFSKPTKGI